MEEIREGICSGLKGECYGECFDIEMGKRKEEEFVLADRGKKRMAQR